MLQNAYMRIIRGGGGGGGVRKTLSTCHLFQYYMYVKYNTELSSVVIYPFNSVSAETLK